MSKRRVEDSDRRPRWRWLLRIGALVLLVVIAYLAVIGVQVEHASGLDERAAADAIVVLGAAQYDGRPSPVLRTRLDHALTLYRDKVAPTIVLTGSKRSSDRFTEAYAGFKYLLAEGVADDDMLIVDDGHSTWESLAAANRVLAERKIDQVVLVSSSYHNRRLQGIASELDLKAQVSPTDGSPTVSQLVGETFRVGVGEILGYRRLYNARG